MEALLCAPLSLHSNPQAAIDINGGKTSKSRRRVVEKVNCTAVGRRGDSAVSTGVHGETSFGSRQLLAGGKFVGLRKSGVREFADCSRVVKRFWWQSTKQRQAHTHTLQVSVRAGLSWLPESNLGLYDPAFDKDGCGVGFVAKLSKEPSRDIVSLL